MPILWNYLLKDYLRFFLLSVCAFVAILLVIRLEDIAHFASLGSTAGKVFLFTLYQIPYILPLAIPIASLIATWVLLQRMSQSHELTALRAAGISLKKITYPLYMMGIVLSLINFMTVSELSSYCRLKSKEMIYKMTTINPLFLLQNEKLKKLKESFVDMELLDYGKEAKNLLVISYNHASKRLSAFSAKEMSLKGTTLIGKNVSLVSSFDSGLENDFDELIIENSEQLHTEADSFAAFINNKKWTLNEDFLPFKLLTIKAKKEPKKKSSHLAYIELTRRLFWTLAPFTFTYLALSFAVHTERSKNRKGFFSVALLGLLFLFFFLTAKSFQKQTLICFSLYATAHPFVILLTRRFSRRYRHE